MRKKTSPKENEQPLQTDQSDHSVEMMLFIPKHRGFRPCVVEFHLAPLASGQLYVIDKIYTKLQPDVPLDIRKLKFENAHLSDEKLMNSIEKVSTFLKAQKGHSRKHNKGLFPD